ncbi:MAG: phosphatidylserine decarboxylase, partial [bacterium]
MDSVVAVYRPMPRQFIIAREGFPFIGIAFVATALLWLVGLYLGCVLMLGVAGFIAFFFRNPERAVPDGEGLIVAPADGRVISVSKNIAAPITGKPS